jgi:hypothetical protein
LAIVVSSTQSRLQTAFAYILHQEEPGHEKGCYKPFFRVFDAITHPF